MSSAVPPARPPPGVAGPSPLAAAAATPATAAPVAPGPPFAPVKALTLREVNLARIAFSVNRFTLFFKGGSRADPSHLLQPCFTLARGIDFSVTAGEVYANSHDLPPLIKQVYKYRNESSLQAAIMVLLISIKSACRKGWFHVTERNELLAMANEMSSSFGYGSGICEESKALSVISTIMPRFYPQMKLDRLLISFEAKRGYDILVADFIVPRNMLPQEKIRLFVAQADNTGTSDCLISPPQVNFLVNGKGVERRTCGYSDVGHQFPTDITKMLKYGSNLIQAVGFFDGNYIIGVAFMSAVTSSGIPVLQDYIQPVVATVAQDAEIIEGPSKISLNCPISFRRIKTPVKGHHCKHHQCFDYENYMAMNARKPRWRCPHCNQSVNFVDIRIDRNMVKILAETGEDVAHVIISADGSWKVVGDHCTADKPHNGMLTGDRDDSARCESDRPSNSSFDVVDLTMEEDSLANVAANSRQIESLSSLASQSGNNNTCDTEERKPFQDVFQGFPVSEFISAAQPATCTSEGVQVTHGQLRDDLWPRITLATPASVAAGNVSQPHIQRVGTGLLAQNPSLDPVITDAVSPALNREDSDNFLLPTSAILSSTQARQFMDNLLLQQTHMGNSIIANETGRRPIPRHVNRTPIAVQALPAQPQIPSFHQRPRTTALTLSSVPSASVQASPSLLVRPGEINAANAGKGRGQQFSRVSNLPLSSSQIHSAIQNRDFQSSQFMLNPATQHVPALPAQNPASARPLPNQQRVGSFGVPPQTGGQGAQQQHHNIWTQQTMSQSTSIASQAPRFSSIPVQQATQAAVNMVAGSLMNHNRGVMAQQSAQSAMLQATMQPPRAPSFQETGDNFRLSGGEQVWNVGEGTPEALRSSGFGDMAAEQGWRPTGRMRGSLTGSAYSAALSHYMLQPDHSASSRPASADQNQNRAVASDLYSPPIANSVVANGSLTEQPSLINEDSGDLLQV